MNISDFRRIQPVYPTNQQFLDLRNNKHDNRNNSKKDYNGQDFKSILQDELDKQK